MVPTLVEGVNCIPTFEKVLQLGPFQMKMINGVPHVSLWFNF